MLIAAQVVFFGNTAGTSSGYSSCSVSEYLRPAYAKAIKPKDRPSLVLGDRAVIHTNTSSRAEGQRDIVS